jgi:hypothetical protein
MLVLAVGGMYLGARVRGTRAAMVMVVMAAAVSLGGRMMLPFDRTNPDIMGYLMIVPALVVIAVSVMAAALANVARRWLGWMVCLSVAALALWQAHLAVPSIVERFVAGDPVERAQGEARELGVARLPPGSVAVTTLYATCFLTWYGRVVEGERPDVRHVPLPFVGYRGEAAVLVDRWEEIAPVVRGFLVSGAVPASEMAALAQDRHVYVEPEPLLEQVHIQYLEPHGLLMAFHPEPVARRDVMAAADVTAARIDDRIMSLPERVLEEPQTQRYLLWWLYNRTLVLARRGYTRGALRSAGQALELMPGVPELEAIARKLATDGEIDDVSPFLPPGS